MSPDEHEPGSLQPVSPAQKARLVSEALSDAARRARFSMRSRRRLQGGGFQARRGDRLFRAAAWISFWLMVALPTAGATVYFGLVASDQYVAEFKFTVAGAEPAPIEPLEPAPRTSRARRVGTTPRLKAELRRSPPDAADGCAATQAPPHSTASTVRIAAVS